MGHLYRHHGCEQLALVTNATSAASDRRTDTFNKGDRSMEGRNRGRDFGVLAAGLAAGVLGSRLLPPLAAMANGTLRARRGGDPFEILISDHRMILSVLDRMMEQREGSNARR